MYRRPVRVANDADLWRKLSAVMLCLAVVATPDRCGHHQCGRSPHADEWLDNAADSWE